MECVDKKVIGLYQETGYSEIPYKRRNFIKIIDFYLFNCPARLTNKTRDLTGTKKYNFTFSKVSARGKTFAERGIEGGSLRTLRAAMQRASYRSEEHTSELQSRI